MLHIKYGPDGCIVGGVESDDDDAPIAYKDPVNEDDYVDPDAVEKEEDEDDDDDEFEDDDEDEEEEEETEDE